MNIEEIAQKCKQASSQIMNASTQTKNDALAAIAKQLDKNREAIQKANTMDLQKAKSEGMSPALLDRMTLHDDRITQMITGIHEVIALPDPIGEISSLQEMPNHLRIGKMRVALGVVGMIYEARPNVSVDASILCLKAGNAIMLRGSHDIVQTNLVLVNCMRQALCTCGLQKEIITLIEDTSHETALHFMRLSSYIDVLIPRGSASLIKTTIEHASIPVLETGSGNCHVYVDKDADRAQAIAIIVNAKTSRTSVCNACESILVHKDIEDAFLYTLLNSLKQHHVIIHTDAYMKALDASCLLATEKDYAKEYLDLEVSIKRVDDVMDAIAHINHYGTHHSETIVTKRQDVAERFLREVDSACVYVNASTRFSDGNAFGLGAEIGISTQKLHARGPMGIKALTCEKYIIYGDGQVR